MGRKAFMFHEEWAQVLSSLPPEMRHTLTDALIDYFMTGVASTFENPAVGGMFTMFKNRMDADDQHYENKCEKNRANASKRKRTLPIASERKQTQANDDNINLNLNTNLNTNLNLKSSNDDDVNIILASSPITKEDLLRKYQLTDEQLHHYGELFNEENKGKKYNGSDTPMKYFQNWLGKRIKKEKEEHDKERTRFGGFTPSSNHNDTTF